MLHLKSYVGHIRNHKALCCELGLSPDMTREEREREIILAAYKKWGNEMGLHLHGMFSFAIYDDEADLLFCLRDPFGTKPFYY